MAPHRGSGREWKGLHVPVILSSDIRSPGQRIHCDRKGRILTIMVPFHREGRHLDVVIFRRKVASGQCVYVPFQIARKVGGIQPVEEGVDIVCGDPTTYKIAYNWSVEIKQICVPHSQVGVWDGEFCHGGSEAKVENHCFLAFSAPNEKSKREQGVKFCEFDES